MRPGLNVAIRAVIDVVNGRACLRVNCWHNYTSPLAWGDVAFRIAGCVCQYHAHQPRFDGDSKSELHAGAHPL